MPRLRRLTLAVVAAALAVLGATSGAVGCTPELPELALVGEQSRLIVLAQVRRVHGDTAYPSGYDLDVRRAIKGQAPGALSITAVKVSLCDDRLGLRINQTIVLAFDVAFRGQVINPHWELERNAIVFGSGPYEQGMSLEQLIASLEGEAVSPAPEPSEVPSVPSGSGAGIGPTVAITAILLALAVIITRIAPSRRRSG